jgi:hypothetical protein
MNLMNELTKQKLDTQTNLSNLPSIAGTQQSMREMLKQYRGLRVQESGHDGQKIPTFDEFSRNISEEWSPGSHSDFIDASQPSQQVGMGSQRVKYVKVKKKKTPLLSTIKTNVQTSGVIGPLSAPVEQRTRIPLVETRQSCSPIEVPHSNSTTNHFSSRDNTLLITQQVDDKLSYLKRRLSSIPSRSTTEKIPEVSTSTPPPVIEESTPTPPVRTPIPMSANTTKNWLALFHGQLLALKVCNSYRSIVERSMAAVREAPLKGNTNSLTHMLKEYIVEVDLEYNRQVMWPHFRSKPYSEFPQTTGQNMI